MSDAFEKYWDRQPSIGPRVPTARMIWNAALEHAAELLDAEGCSCDSPEAEEDGEHFDSCPTAMATEIRKSQSQIAQPQHGRGIDNAE